MFDHMNWEPLLYAIQAFVVFVLICFGAAVSDLWAKGCRKPKPRQSPVAIVKGERVFLN